MLRPHDELFTPPGEGPFPTVLMFHGCGGKHENSRDWAKAFRAVGWASIVVDGFTGRGADPARVCTGRELLPNERAGDILVTLEYARTLPFVDSNRMVIAGWSHGGTALLDVLDLDVHDELPPNLLPLPSLGLNGVTGAIFFYPYCGIGARVGVWTPAIASLFLLAGEDKTANPEPCIEATEELAAAGHRVTLQVYPGIDHAFDHRTLPASSRLRYEADATADAVKKVHAFLGAV
jgi:dienelactone hydrolase